jgi:stage IV sporulation protein FA
VKRDDGMARSTPEEIRRRIAKRKKAKGTASTSSDSQMFWPDYDEKYEFNYVPPSAGGDDDGHPLFKKEVFFFKILASILLFLVVAILFRNQSERLEPVRDVILQTMNEDFKFAAVAEWYEERFGKPLALLPFNEEKLSAEKEENQKGAEPVSGKILENFEKNGQGIMIETIKGSPVHSIKGGMVEFVGVKEGLGETVIIQHGDKTETWYANLENIKVKPYEYIEKNTEIGTVSDLKGEDKTKGQYYFAVKKGDEFIDPIQVIRLE